MNPYDIIYHFYPNDTALRRLLILHSEKVRDKAFSILETARQNNSFTGLLSIDEQLMVPYFTILALAGRMDLEFIVKAVNLTFAMVS